LTWADKDILSRALMDLRARGFCVVEAKATLRRLRNRHVDPGDRKGEPSEASPVRKFAGEAEDLPF
jgi:hypothetical protein